MLGRPYATHKKTNFDIYVYLPQLRRKPGILNTRFLFLQYKKTHTKNINTHALPDYYSSELNFTWIVTNTTKNACKSWE